MMVFETKGENFAQESDGIYTDLDYESGSLDGPIGHEIKLRHCEWGLACVVTRPGCIGLSLAVSQSGRRVICYASFAEHEADQIESTVCLLVVLLSDA